MTPPNLITHYRIGKASELLNIKLRTMRKYVHEKKIQVHRDKSGYLWFEKQYIHDLMKRQG